MNTNTHKDQFANNVHRLYDKYLTSKQPPEDSSDVDCIAMLKKESSPLKVIENQDDVWFIYNNLSLCIRYDFSSMSISYDGEDAVVLTDAAKYAPRQLLAFIEAIEKDTIHLQDLWQKENTECRKKRIWFLQLQKRCFRKFRFSWMSVMELKNPRLNEQYLIRYLNLKGYEIMLSSWNLKNTVADIKDECLRQGLGDVVQQWQKDFVDFTNQCASIKNRNRLRREYKRKIQEKNRHLASIKRVKLEAMLKSIDLNHDFKVFIGNILTAFPRRTREFRFTIDLQLKIRNATCDYRLNSVNLDAKTMALVESISRINDIVPRLTKLVEKNEQQGYYLLGNIECSRRSHYDYELNWNPFSIVTIGSDGFMTRCNNKSTLCKLVEEINQIVLGLDSES